MNDDVFPQQMNNQIAPISRELAQFRDYVAKQGELAVTAEVMMTHARATEVINKNPVMNEFIKELAQMRVDFWLDRNISEIYGGYHKPSGGYLHG